jgi:UDP-N-acetylmuramoylalanine--D-glutamate ligase
MEYNGKSVLVAGAGRSGISAARFLLHHGARVILTDMKTRNILEPGISSLTNLPLPSDKLVLELGRNREESFAQCDLVVVSPGMPLALPVFQISRKAGIPIIAEIELASRHLQGTIIGITGSNGKTTTTTLVSELLFGAGLKAHAAGNIGTPLIDFVEDSTPADIHVVELSSFQLEAVHEFRPRIGSILNLTPDHMDRYENFDGYISAKKRIFMNQKRTDFAVLNADDPRTASMKNETGAQPVLFSRQNIVEYGTFVRNGRILFRDERGEQDLLAVSAIGLKGAHNLENVLAASAMAILAGAPPESLEENVRKFRAVEHRIEYVAQLHGVQYFNDSKATNVDATIKAIEAFPGNILLIAGGRDKESDFTVLQSPVRRRVKHLVVIGEAAEKLKQALSDATDISEAASMEEAVSLCSRIAKAGDVVLLAPACASFDMFQNYEHRGRVFKEAVRNLQQE